jgi:hypothetical protein
MRSDLKKLDKIKDKREALAGGKPILTGQEKADVDKYSMQ